MDIEIICSPSQNDNSPIRMNFEYTISDDVTCTQTLAAMVKVLRDCTYSDICIKNALENLIECESVDEMIACYMYD